MIVRESINFERGKEPKISMSVGTLEAIKNFAVSKSEIMFSERDFPWICAKYGKLEYLQFLIDNGFDIKAGDDKALRYAAIENHPEVLKLLIKAGGNVHADDDFAICAAAASGFLEIVKILLDAGADPNARKNDPLNMSYNNDQKEVFDYITNWIKEHGGRGLHEGMDFERGQDPKKLLKIGVNQAILNGLKKLQLSPGVGSINLTGGGFQISVDDYNRKYSEDFKSLLDECFPLLPFSEVKVDSKRSKSFRKQFIAKFKPEYIEIFRDSFDEVGFVKD